MKVKPRKTVVSAKLPQPARIFIADDIRIEQGGKASLLGFFSDNVVVVPLPKDVPSPSREKAIALSGLAFLMNFPIKGSYEANLKFLAPDGQPLIIGKGNVVS